MTIVYKFVGNKKSNNKIEMFHKDWDVSKTTINFDIVVEYFKNLGITEKIETVKFITNSETMKSDKEYPIGSNLIIFVFTVDAKVREQISSIFDSHGYEVKKSNPIPVTQAKPVVDLSLENPIPEDKLVMTQDSINRSNEEAVKNFDNKDFKTLLKVYINNPNAFKTFASYISSGDVLPTSLPEVKEEADYSEQLKIIQDLNLGLSDTKINSTLNKFSGHLNLTLRFLLAVDCLSSK